MRRPVRLRSMVVSAALAALALVLPVAFHAVGLGSHFLPMFLPLLLNSFLSTAGWAIGTALMVPWISALATGMPPLYPPVAALISAEAGVTCLVAALLWRRWRNLWLALIPAVVAGRLACFLLTWAVAQFFELPPGLAATARLLQGLPGVALQLTVIPIVLKMLSARGSALFGDD